jgi:hypothetical protein
MMMMMCMMNVKPLTERKKERMDDGSKTFNPIKDNYNSTTTGMMITMQYTTLFIHASIRGRQYDRRRSGRVFFDRDGVYMNE